MVDRREARDKGNVRTARVLYLFDRHLNQLGGAVVCVEYGGRRPICIIPLAGSDLIHTITEPILWGEQDVGLASSSSLSAKLGQSSLFFSR